MEKNAPLILLAAGGTGGHLFPAEALGVELIRRGFRVRLATDSRALRYSGLFSRDTIDVVPSETVRGRSPWSLARTGALLALFAFVVNRTLTRAYATEDTFSRFAASGLAILFGVQAAINMSVNLQLIPAKGMTLPFISYGGSSIVSLAYGVGMMLALTRQRPRTEIESMEGASAARSYA